jgi:hypothetical protein
MTRFRNALLLVGVGAAAFGLGTGISTAQEDGSTTEPPTEEQAPAEGSERSAEAQAFRECMTDNGVSRGDARERRRGELSDEETAALDQAWEACKDLIPQPSAEEQAQIDSWKTCLEENGVDLPEIDRTLPPSQRPERSELPEIDRETMKAAHEACEDLKPEGMGFGFGGPGHRGPGGPGCDKDGEAPATGESDDAPATEEEPTVEGSSFRPVRLHL